VWEAKEPLSTLFMADSHVNQQFALIKASLHDTLLRCENTTPDPVASSSQKVDAALSIRKNLCEGILSTD
jgi:hypothetical protein